jgi:uncharacterized membrane protein
VRSRVLLATTCFACFHAISFKITIYAMQAIKVLAGVSAERLVAFELLWTPQVMLQYVARALAASKQV